MKINGYKLQTAIKQAQEQREFAEKRFHGGIFAFPGEKKPNPGATAVEIVKLEAKIARLQAAQASYNLQVQIVTDAGSLSLHQAVKLVGGAARIEKLWKEALSQVSGETVDRYGGGRQRQADAIIATPQVSIEEAEAAANAASTYTRMLREKIAAANATEIDLDVSLA